MFSKTRILMPLVLLAAVLAAGGCGGRHDREARGGRGGQARQTLTIKGSDTMVILAQKWAERYMQEHPGTQIQVSGGGSGTGIAALLNGTTDLANSSRPIKARETDSLRASRNVEVVETRVALDALAVYVHAQNPLQSLTVPQLKAIFRGQITNWRELGGPDARIVLYSRENNSGTYAYFKEHVLGDEDFAATAQTLPGTAAVINAVSRDRNGIGYGGIAYAEGIKTVPVATEGGEPVTPSMENAVSGAYPLARFLYVYAPGQPQGVAQSFLEFVRSPAGQAVVEGVGFYPLPSEGAAPAPAGEIPGN